MTSLQLQVCSYLLWFPLMLLTIQATLHAGVRRYPLILTYLVCTFLIGVAQAPAALAYHRSYRQGEWLQVVQTAGEVTAYALLLLVVFSLIYQATSHFGGRRMTRTILTAVPLLVIAISFLIHYNPKEPLGVWVTRWTRDLKFCAAVLDMALWSLLLMTRNRNARLLLLTGGMGVMFAGNAIGESVKSLAIARRSNTLFLVGAGLSAAADLAFLFIWWRSFRDGEGRRQTPARAASR
jgi:hypothetical protein